MSFRDIEVPWGEIGYITFKRTYSRRIKEDDPNSRTEEFWQVIQRELDASDKQLKVGFTEEEKRRYAELRMKLKFSTAGRFMWQLGTKTVDKLGLPSLQNCAFVSVNEPIRPFTWAFEMLMLGSGVGYNIQKHNVYQLPKLKGKIRIERKDTNDADYIVPDTREGWVKLLGKVLKAHFYSEEGFTFSTICIRSKGAPIKGFGGSASGPEDLCWGINEINKILNSRSNKKLRPIDCLDIMNIIGAVVVSGNVRRSAQIAIGDYDDLEFLKSKRWDIGSIPNWRAMSNNSIVAPDNIDDIPNEFWDTYNQGEPFGLINLELTKAIGRTGETQYPDPDVEGFNPCITGDMLVAVADGRNAVQIKDLVGTTYPVYTIKDNKVTIGTSTRTWKTRENAEIWKLTLDDGSILKATPDHLIMLRNGEYKQLKDLKEGESLMPFNTYRSNHNYRQISSNTGRDNHKVKSIEFVGYEDVYDMTVENTHNFAIITSNKDQRFIESSGIFIHNCAEQGLNSYESCCLAEVFLPNIESSSELLEVLKFAYRINKHSLALHCSLKETESIVNKNMRMGIGMTGILQATEEQRSWLSDAYVWLREYDKWYSGEHGFPNSIKLTTVKPSGCVSPSTKIKTSMGILSYEDIFKLNGIELNEKINECREWYDINFNISVLDVNGNYQRINKLFINGYEETIKLTFDDGFIVECTPNHKFLLKNGSWKMAKDISEDDDIEDKFIEKTIKF